MNLKKISIVNWRKEAGLAVGPSHYHTFAPVCMHSFCSSLCSVKSHRLVRQYLGLIFMCLGNLFRSAACANSTEEVPQGKCNV